MRESRREGGRAKDEKVFPSSYRLRLCCVLVKKNGPVSLPFVVVRPFSSEAVSFPVSCLRLVACLPSVSSPHNRLVGRLVLFVSSGVSFYPSCFPRSRSILIRLRLRLRFRSSCFVDEVMRERNEGEDQT